MSTPPNILLIVTDQQRGDGLGIDPHAPRCLQTPNLDFLARSGTHFLHGYSECPSCIPARRTLMSGMAPAAQGMVGFQGGVEWNPPATLAGELSRAGYQTEMIGKLHLHPLRRRYGFQHMQPADATRGQENDYVEWLRTVHGRHEQDPGMAHGVSANGWVGRPHHLPEEQMHTFWVVDRAIEFLRRRDPDAPFFLNLSFIDPHPPLTPPRFYYDRYIDRELPEPDVGDWALSLYGHSKGLDPNASRIAIDHWQMHCARAAYYGMINFIDDQVGRLFQAVPELADAFVLFTSDHGEMLGDHHLFRKTWPYEASARVPFVMRAPRNWELPGEICPPGVVGWQDIMPTLLHAAGTPVPAHCTGHSLLPLLRGEQERVRDVLHGEHAGCYDDDHGNHFLCNGSHKYIWYSQTGTEQLFNLVEDPRELEDLARGEQAEAELGRWRQQLAEILRDRPEGFVANGELVDRRPHRELVPGYQPDSVFSFL
ncbi:MAG: arylsulfatase [Candidatus Latescibacterota bacterium]|nr:arylsulfatase [Candidatus Latescibacterota bacterium]